MKPTRLTRKGHDRPRHLHTSTAECVACRMEIRVGARNLDLGSFAHRTDHRNSRDRRGRASPREFESSSRHGPPAPGFTVCNPDRDWLGRCGWTASGCVARHRGRDLGSRVLVVGCDRFAFGCNPLFCGFDVHTWRLGTDAARALADNGGA